MRLIDADNLINVIENSYLTAGEKRLFKIKVNKAPTVEVPKNEWPGPMPDLNMRIITGPREGEWLELWDVYCICSVCKGRQVKYFNYCPDCGARMLKASEGRND